MKANTQINFILSKGILHQYNQTRYTYYYSVTGVLRVTICIKHKHRNCDSVFKEIHNIHCWVSFFSIHLNLPQLYSCLLLCTLFAAKMNNNFCRIMKNTELDVINSESENSELQGNLWFMWDDGEKLNRKYIFLCNKTFDVVLSNVYSSIYFLSSLKHKINDIGSFFRWISNWFIFHLFFILKTSLLYLFYFKEQIFRNVYIYVINAKSKKKPKDMWYGFDFFFAINRSTVKRDGRRRHH